MCFLSFVCVSFFSSLFLILCVTLSHCIPCSRVCVCVSICTDAGFCVCLHVYEHMCGCSYVCVCVCEWWLAIWMGFHWSATSSLSTLLPLCWLFAVFGRLPGLTHIPQTGGVTPFLFSTTAWNELKLHESIQHFKILYLHFLKCCMANPCELLHFSHEEMNV